MDVKGQLGGCTGYLALGAKSVAGALPFINATSLNTLVCIEYSGTKAWFDAWVMFVKCRLDAQ